MGLFSSDTKPRVTREEWKKVRSTLYYTHNFPAALLDRLEEDMRGDMFEEYERDNGVDAFELDKLVAFLREKSVPKGIISSEKVDIFEAEMKKYI